jgi:predicted GIY-YIG superfamily endonuclease
MGIRKLPWTVYILECGDTTMYTGISLNVEQRLATHEKGKGARYTKNRGPFALVYAEQKETHGEALKREREIKSLKRQEKLKLISEFPKPHVP